MYILAQPLSHVFAFNILHISLKLNKALCFNIYRYDYFYAEFGLKYYF